MSEEQAIGTARIDVIVDTAQLDIAVDRAKNRTAAMSNAAQQEYAKLDRAEKRRVDRLIDQANTLNLTKEQQLAYNAALRTNGALLDEVKKKITQNTAAQNANGISAKQTAAAMRGVPAQITDIFTSLQGGQRPMTVLLQQGGQLKDMFGGIVPAARALGSSLLGLVNPATLAAGAGVALLAAWKQGSDEATAYGRALIETGGYAARTADELRGLAREFDGIANVTEGAAAKAITSIVASGRFTAEQLEVVGRAAVTWSAATGESVDDVIARFVRLSDDPVKAIIALNKSQHFLTEETIKQIDSLDEQGRHVEAATLAIETYATTLQDRAEKIVPNLGAIERGWNKIKSAAKEAWDGMLNIGRDETLDVLQKRLESFQRRLAQPNLLVGDRKEAERWVAKLQAQIAPLQAKLVEQGVAAAFDQTVDSGSFEDGKKARDAWDRIVLSNLSKREKLEREIADIRAKGLAAGKTESEIEAQIASARARYKESLPKGNKTNADDNSAQTLLETIKRQITANEQLSETGEKVSASDRLVIQARQLLSDKTNTMTASTRKLLEAMLPTLQASDEAAKRAAAEAKAKEALARQNAILVQQTENRRAANAQSLASYGHGDEYVDLMQRRLDIQREYTAELKRLGDRGVADDKAAWDRMAENARQHRDQQLREEDQYQRERIQKMLDWRNGAKSALEDYIAKAKDVAGQTRAAWTNAFTSAEDALVKFTQSGKLNFSDLADSIIADLTRIASKQAVSGLASWLGGLFGGAGGTSTQSSKIVNIKANAAGGVYSSPSLSAYSGQVRDKPTLFAFAKGAGVFGEAGPEAIMPLTRTSGGRLGVQAVGAVQDVQVNVTIEKGAPEDRVEQTRGADGSLNLRIMVRDAVRGFIGDGSLDDVAGASWGVRRRGASYG